MWTSIERERKGKIVYTVETLKELIEKELWPKEIEIVNTSENKTINCCLIGDFLLFVYYLKGRDEINWHLVINKNVQLRIKTGHANGIKNGTVEEAIQYIKSFLISVRKWEALVDANTYWETEQTDQGLMFVQDIKRYEEGKW